MPGAQINPILIQQLTGKDIMDIPESPTVSWLPGSYAGLVNKHKEKVERHFGENSFMIKCKSCERKGKYNVGMMVINTDIEDVEKSVQTTGYFRCKHCNDAGNWEMPSQFIIASTAGLLANRLSETENSFMVGKSLLYDGSWHQFCSDSELHLLNQLKKDPNNSFVWNRLGNSYSKGNRPELAAAVFEHSTVIDHGQIESHYSLGGYFLQIGDFEKSAYHFKQMLIGASDYHPINVEKLRGLMAHGLTDLFFIYQHSNGEIKFLPTKEELVAAGKMKDSENIDFYTEVNITPGDPESFYPIAERYMGSNRKKLPTKLRTMKDPKPSKQGKRKHKKRKKRKKR